MYSLLLPIFRIWNCWFLCNETVTTGEGGILTANDPTLYDRAVHLKGKSLAKGRAYWPVTFRIR